VQNIVVNMFEKFHNDRLRNGRSLGNGKKLFDNKKKNNNNNGDDNDNDNNNNNNNMNNVRSAWRPVSGSNYKLPRNDVSVLTVLEDERIGDAAVIERDHL